MRFRNFSGSCAASLRQSQARHAGPLYAVPRQRLKTFGVRSVLQVQVLELAVEHNRECRNLGKRRTRKNAQPARTDTMSRPQHFVTITICCERICRADAAIEALMKRHTFLPALALSLGSIAAAPA